ncbi:hypothetical protein D3C87_1475110 [compost metagenome]
MVPMGCPTNLLLVMSLITPSCSWVIFPLLMEIFRSVVQLNSFLPSPLKFTVLTWNSSPLFSDLPTLVKMALGIPEVNGRFCGSSNLSVYTWYASIEPVTLLLNKPKSTAIFAVVVFSHVNAGLGTFERYKPVVVLSPKL